MLLLCGQAQAADYVKCEAMQKAHSRLLDEKLRVGWAAYDNKLVELCPYADGPERLRCTTKAVHEASIASVKKVFAEYNARLAKVKADYAKEGCP